MVVSDVDANASSNSWWDVGRFEVLRLLENLEDASLAAMYRFAINLMSKPAMPGEERARLSNVGHCFREILNNLPEALNDVQGVPPRGHDDGKSAKQLASAIRDTLDGASTPIGHDEDSETSLRVVSVPAPLVEAMTQFANEHQEVSKRVARRDAASVLGRVDPQDPALKPWTAARTFFMRKTHLNIGEPTKKSSSIPSDAEVRAHISNIEASLTARLGKFFDTVESLDDLLDVANRQHDHTEGMLDK